MSNERQYIYQREIERAVKSAASSVYSRFRHSSIDSEDLVQEGLLKAYELMDNYQPDRGSVMTYLWQRVSKTLERHVIKNIRQSGMLSLDAVENNLSGIERRNEPSHFVRQEDEANEDLFDDSINIFDEKQFRGHRNLVDYPRPDVIIDVNNILDELEPEDRDLVVDRFVHGETLETLSLRYETPKSTIRRRLIDLTERIKSRYEHGGVCETTSAV